METNRTHAILTFEEIRVAIADSIGIDPREVTPTSNLVRDLDIASLDRAQLILDLEDVAGIEIPDDDAEKLFTVQDILNYLDSRSHT